MAPKRLIFKSVDLGDDITLKIYLTLASSVQDLFAKLPPVQPWRETTMSALGHNTLDVTWNSQLVFTKSQVLENGRAVPAASMPIEIGQETTLIKKYSGPNDPPTYSFTEPIPREGLTSVKAINNTGHPVPLSLDFITNPGMADEIVHLGLPWDEVGDGEYVSGMPQPVLRAYVARKYQRSGWLSGGLGSSQPVWQADVLSLSPETTIEIFKVAATGRFEAEAEASTGSYAIEPPSPPRTPHGWHGALPKVPQANGVPKPKENGQPIHISISRSWSPETTPGVGNAPEPAAAAAETPRVSKVLKRHGREVKENPVKEDAGQPVIISIWPSGSESPGAGPSAPVKGVTWGQSVEDGRPSWHSGTSGWKQPTFVAPRVEVFA